MITKSNHKTPRKSGRESRDEKDGSISRTEKVYMFVPKAIETVGSLGHMGIKYIKELGRKIKEKTGEKRSSQYLFQRISMDIQRGNAASILGKLSSTGQLDEIFYL